MIFNYDDTNQPFSDSYPVEAISRAKFDVCTPSSLI